MSHASRSCSAFLTGGTALYRASQLRKRVAKLRGRTTDDSLKRAIEVRHGLKSASEGNFTNSRVGIEQKRLRFLHSNSRALLRPSRENRECGYPHTLALRFLRVPQTK